MNLPKLPFRWGFTVFDDVYSLGARVAYCLEVSECVVYCGASSEFAHATEPQIMITQLPYIYHTIYSTRIR